MELLNAETPNKSQKLGQKVECQVGVGAIEPIVQLTLNRIRKNQIKKEVINITFDPHHFLVFNVRGWVFTATL